MIRTACLLVGVSAYLASPALALTTSRQAAKPTSEVVVPTRRQAVPDADLEARTAAVAATLRCPVCQGESIQDSPAELAQQMRAIVKERLRAGETPEQIQAYFMARYGEWILLKPRRAGLNIVLYALPIALVLGGLILVVVLVRRWTTPENSTAGQSSV